MRSGSSEVTKALSQIFHNTYNLTLSDAKMIIEFAEQKADALALPAVATVVDKGGNLIAQHRMDDALLGSIQISFQKAFTAIALQSSTEALAKEILPGSPLYGLQNTHTGQFCLFGGGIPLLKGNRYAGAIGISGGSVEEDIEIAQYAADRFYQKITA